MRSPYAAGRANSPGNSGETTPGTKNAKERAGNNFPVS
jgi:hypothetical protein